MRKRKTTQIDRGFLNLIEGCSHLFDSNDEEYYYLKVYDNLFIIISISLNNGCADLFAVSGMNSESELKDLIDDDFSWFEHYCVTNLMLNLQLYKTNPKIFKQITTLNDFLMKNKNSPVSSADLANVLEL